MDSRTLTAAARLCLIAAVAAIAWLATTDRSVPGLERLSDKLLHAAAFAALAWLVDLSFPESPFGPAKVAALLAFGVAIEAVQYFLPYREASWLDVVADAAGVATYILCRPLLAKATAPRRPLKE